MKPIAGLFINGARADDFTGQGGYTVFLFTIISMLSTFASYGQTIQCCSCIDAVNLICGEFTFGNTDEGSNNNSTYVCLGDTLSGFDAPEMIYRITPSEGFEFDLTLNFQDDDDQGLDLFILRECTVEEDAECIAYKERTGLNQSNETITLKGLDASFTYIIIIDARSTTGSFSLEIECTPSFFICDMADTIFCGEEILANNADGQNDFFNYGCFGNDLDDFDSPELIYFITGRPDEEHSLEIVIDDFEQQGLDLFVLADCGLDSFECVAFKERTSESPAMDRMTVLQTDPSRDYYIIVDALNGEGDFSLKVNCLSKFPPCEDRSQSISCGVTLQSDTDTANNSYDLDFYGQFGIDGHCVGADNCCNYSNGDLLYEFTINEANRVVLECNIISREFSDTTGLFLFRNLCSNDPVYITRTESADTNIRIDIPLEAGTYQLLIDKKCITIVGVIPMELTISLNCYPLPSVCDLGAKFIDRGNLFDDKLTGDEALPFLFTNISCLQNEFQFEANLASRSYVYFNEDVSDNLSINLEADPNVFVFLHSCTCDFLCEAFCEGFTNGDGSIDLDLADKSTYIITIVGPEQSLYRLGLTPSGPCSDLQVEQIECGFSESGNVDSGFSEFDTENEDRNIYSGCYDGNRTYLGGEFIYRFDLAQPSFVSFKLSDNTDLGMFLFNQNCGEQCLAYAEILSEDGTGSIDNIPLDIGQYFLVIDQDSQNGDPNFNLSFDCNVDDAFSSFLIGDMCASILNQPHNVSISGLDQNTTIGSKTISSGDEIAFFYRENNNEIVSQSRIWNNTGVVFELQGDDPDQEDKCGFEENEDFLIKVNKNFGTKRETYVVQASYMNVDSLVAPNQFQFNGTSFINQIASDPTILPTHLGIDVQYAVVPQSGATIDLQIKSNVSWEILVSEDINQLTVNPTTGFNNAKVTITAGDLNEPERTDTIYVKGSNGIVRRLIVVRLADTLDAVTQLSKLQYLMFYPNPTEGRIYIESEESLMNVNISTYDMLGRSIHPEMISGPKSVSLDLSDFPPGMYFVSIKEGRHFETRKILLH